MEHPVPVTPSRHLPGEALCYFLISEPYRLILFFDAEVPGSCAAFWTGLYQPVKK